METMPFPTTQSRIRANEFVRGVYKGWIMMRQMLLGLVTLGVLLGCGTSPQFYGWPTQGGTGPSPVIEAYYASNTASPGDTWKIFLRAKDRERDMLYIACMVSETGYGPLNTVEIHLTGKDRAEFSGYLAMPIQFEDPFEASGINLTTTILIRDEQGNASQSVNLPLVLSGVAPQTVPAQWKDAASHHLGDISIDFSLLRPTGDTSVD
jgi:hypothetical protein